MLVSDFTTTWPSAGGFMFAGIGVFDAFLCIALGLATLIASIRKKTRSRTDYLLESFIFANACYAVLLIATIIIGYKGTILQETSCYILTAMRSCSTAILTLQYYSSSQGLNNMRHHFIAFALHSSFSSILCFLCLGFSKFWNLSNVYGFVGRCAILMALAVHQGHLRRMVIDCQINNPVAADQLRQHSTNVLSRNRVSLWLNVFAETGFVMSMFHGSDRYSPAIESVCLAVFLLLDAIRTARLAVHDKRSTAGGLRVGDGQKQPFLNSVDFMDDPECSDMKEKNLDV